MSEKPRFRRTANPPVERASTVLVQSARDLYNSEVVSYGRSGLAAQDALKAELMARTGAAGCSLFSSGLEACASALQALVKAGDHVLMTDSVYIPTRRYCDTTLARFGVETEYYDPRIGAGISSLIRKNTAVVYMESPGSVTFEIQDVPAIAAAARAGGAVSVIDDTWSALSRLRPIELGVDVVAHSATKYPSGGSDVFLGAVLSRTPEIAERIAFQSKVNGASVSPEDAYLVLRSLQSLEARLAQHEASALKIAEWLGGRPEVSLVLHPAHPDHPDHALWKRDFTGSTGLFSVVFKKVPDRKAHAFLDALDVFGLGFSYGGFESLALWCDPQIKRDHADWSKEGVVMRFSIGLELADALIADLERGFAAMARA